MPVWEQFQKDLESVLRADRPERLVIDFSGLDRIEGQGLVSTPMNSVFISAMKFVQNLGGALALCGLPTSVQESYGALGLDGAFTIYDTAANAAEALESLSNSHG